MGLPQLSTPMAMAEVPRMAADEALVSDAKAGDHHAFVELCNRYGRFAKQRIYRIVRNREDCEDVFQETLMRAYKHISGFRGSCTFKSWLTQIGINTALMLLRSRRSRSEISFEIVGEQGEIIDGWEAPDPSPNPEQLFLMSQRNQILSEAVIGLPSIFRQIVEQFHWNESRLTDAARAIGLKEATAKSRLFRARALLRNRFQDRASGWI